MTAIRCHEGDLPDLDRYQNPVDGCVAIDTETMGLTIARDRLCVVQLSPGDGSADVVRIARGQTSAPNITALVSDQRITKLYHFGRFDIATIANRFGALASPVWDTKIASKLVRTYTDRHGLKELTRELAGIDISKQQQSSDWGADALSEAQMLYAASDVLHLHVLRRELVARLEREGRTALAEACFAFLPVRARLDLAGWEETDIFAHS